MTDRPLPRPRAARHATRLPFAATLAALTALGGCAGLGSAPPPRLFALAGAPAAAAPVPCAMGFSIRDVRVAGHLDRAEIVTGREGPEIRAAADALWAAPLRAELPRLTAALLGQRLAGSRVVPYPWRFNEWPDAAFTFDIDRMEPVGDALQLAATWTAAVPGSAPRALGGGRFETTVPMSGHGAAATVRAADVALGRLADAVAAQAAPGGRLASGCPTPLPGGRG